MTTEKLWYAVERDAEDNDWGTGSYDYKEAVQMARELGPEAQIAVIEEGPDPICVEVITSENF